MATKRRTPEQAALIREAADEIRNNMTWDKYIELLQDIPWEQKEVILEYLRGGFWRKAGRLSGPPLRKLLQEEAIDLVEK